jgi:hypothetical protein
MGAEQDDTPVESRIAHAGHCDQKLSAKIHQSPHHPWRKDAAVARRPQVQSARASIPSL